MGTIWNSYQIQMTSGNGTLTRNGCTQAKNSSEDLEAWKSLLRAPVDFPRQPFSLEPCSTYSLAVISQQKTHVPNADAPSPYKVRIFPISPQSSSPPPNMPSFSP